MTDDHRMHENSIDAWADVVDRLTEYQTVILDAIKSFAASGYQPMDEEVLNWCRQNVASCEHWQINNVTGLIRRLIDTGYVVESGKRKHGGTNHNRRVLRPATRSEYGERLAATQYQPASEKARVLRRLVLRVRESAVSAGLFGSDIVCDIDATMKELGYNLPGGEE